MDSVALFNRVVRHIGEYVEADVSHLRPDSRVATAIPGLDSVKLFEMTLYLEDCLGVEFEETVMEHIDSLQDLIDYIQSRSPQLAEESSCATLEI